MFELNDRVVLVTDIFGEYLPKGSHGVVVRFAFPWDHSRPIVRFDTSRFGTSDFSLDAHEVSKIRENPTTTALGPQMPLHRKSGVRFSVPRKSGSFTVPKKSGIR